MMPGRLFLRGILLLAALLPLGALAQAEAPRIRVALAEFVKQSGDARFDFLQAAIPGMVQAGLLSDERLAILGPDEISARLDRAGLPPRTRWGQGAVSHEVAQALDADLLLEGTFVEFQGEIVINARLHRLRTQGADRLAPVSIDETSVSPKFGVVWRVGSGATAYLQYAHGFRAPPFDDVNIGFDLPQFNYRAIPNPDLESERSDSIELGLRFGSDAVQGSTAVFAGRYRDFIESRVNIGVDPETGTTLFQSQNLASAEIAGLEAALEFALGAWHPALARFSGSLTASWTDGEDTSTGDPINSVDPPRGMLGLHYDASGGIFGASLELTVVGAKHGVDESAGPLFRPDGHEVLDLRLQWRPHPRITANLGLFNLADAAYHEWSAVRGLAPTDPLLPLYREPGRNFAVTVAVTLD